jgi:hypothetical protein
MKDFFIDIGLLIIFIGIAVGAALLLSDAIFGKVAVTEWIANLIA